MLTMTLRTHGLLVLIGCFAFSLQSQSQSSSNDFIRYKGSAVRIGEESIEGPDLFENVRGITLDQNGHVYVLDGGDNSIRAFSRSGSFIGRTGRSGRGPGDFTFPYAIMHDGDSTLYVTDEANGVNSTPIR